MYYLMQHISYEGSTAIAKTEYEDIAKELKEKLNNRGLGPGIRYYVTDMGDVPEVSGWEDFLIQMDWTDST